MIRIVRLAQVAAQAEALVLKRTVRRAGRRAIYGAVAAVFGVALLVMLHVVGWFALAGFGGITSFWSSVIVLAVDLVIAGAFGVLAAGKLPDPVEVEARDLRDRTLLEMRNTGLLALAMGPAGRIAGRGAFGLARNLVGREKRR